MASTWPGFAGAESTFARITAPRIKPATNGGSKAWVTRRVGGDQNGSDSLSACRRTRKSEPPKATRLTAAQ